MERCRRGDSLYSYCAEGWAPVGRAKSQDPYFPLFSDRPGILDFPELYMGLCRAHPYEISVIFAMEMGIL